MKKLEHVDCTGAEAQSIGFTLGFDETRQKTIEVEQLSECEGSDVEAGLDVPEREPGPPASNKASFSSKIVNSMIVTGEVRLHAVNNATETVVREEVIFPAREVSGDLKGQCWCECISEKPFRSGHGP